MKKIRKEDLSQEVFDLYDAYAHNKIDRRQFMDKLSNYAVGGITVAGLASFLLPKYAEARQVKPDDPRLKSEYIEYDSPKGAGKMKGLLSMPANWAQSGHGGCQSSVMSWGRKYDFWKSFCVDRIDVPKNGNCGAYEGLWGDQEFITREVGPPGKHIKPMAGVYSYKYHCRNGLPRDSRVVCFHGTPKPSEVSDSWVARLRSM